MSDKTDKMNKPEEQDIPFEDVSSQDAPSDAPSTDRTPPGPGSTRPTSVREDLGTLAEEARKLWETIETRVVAPAVESYPEVARHLGAAGREVARALRAAVRGSEQNWRDGGAAGHPSDGSRQQERITVERVDRIDPPEQKNRDQ
jgi:alkylated DNA nucleotide flippase Atl1